jgi:serine/threonine-protein kinase
MSRPTLISSTIGEYRLVGKLGEGGMGEVYQGVHSKIGRVVAIKILSEAAAGPEFVERFLNEARIQAGLQHNNIATLYDFLEYNGQPCIIMEYIEGQTLTDCIHSRGCLPLAEALQYFESIVEAIAYVHSRGIVHRDIKSNNVKITPLGQVKLLDFGIAKSGASPALTVTGGFVGTLQYLSPEQIQGGFADTRSDIWALGVLLYEMTTSHLPFDATTLGDLCQKIGKADYVPPSVMNQAVPRDVQNIIARCLKKTPSARYQSARELLQDVNHMIAGLSSQAAKPATSFASTPKHSEPAPSFSPHPVIETLDTKPKSKVPILVAVAAVVLLAIISGLYLLFAGDSNPTGNRSPSAHAQQQTYTLATMDGPAEVYRNGQRVGTTPYEFQAKSGEEVFFVLKREGYLDKPAHFTAIENSKKPYTYTLEKRQ